MQPLASTKKGRSAFPSSPSPSEKRKEPAVEDPANGRPRGQNTSAVSARKSTFSPRAISNPVASCLSSLGWVKGHLPFVLVVLYSVRLGLSGLITVYLLRLAVPDAVAFPPGGGPSVPFFFENPEDRRAGHRRVACPGLQQLLFDGLIPNPLDLLGKNAS